MAPGASPTTLTVLITRWAFPFIAHVRRVTPAPRKSGRRTATSTPRRVRNERVSCGFLARGKVDV